MPEQQQSSLLCSALVSRRWRAAAAWLLLASAALVGGTAQAQTTVDLVMNKIGPAVSLNGGPITYTLEISNGGPADADGATFSDPIPVGVTNIAATCTGATLGAVCPASINIAGQTVSGTIPTLPNSGTVTIQVTGTLVVRPGPASLSNTATVSVPVGRTETDPSTNTSTANTSVTYQAADVTAVQGVHTVNGVPNATSYAFGDTITYTVTHTNNGPGPADLSRLLGILGSGGGSVTAVNTSNRVVTCQALGGAVCPSSTAIPPAGQMGNTSSFYTSTVPIWPSGGSLVFTVSYQVDSYVNAALQCGTGTRQFNMNYRGVSQLNPAGTPVLPDLNTANDTSALSSITGPVLTQDPCPDLETFKSQSSTTWSFNTPHTYTVVHTNNGPGSADGSIIRDNMAIVGNSGSVTGVTFDSAEVVSCTPSGGAVCPASFTVVSSGTVIGSYGTRYSASVPTWPANGVLTVVYRLTPRSFVKSASCGPQPISTANLMNQGASLLSGVLDPVPANNLYVIQTTGGPELANPPCAQADIAVTKTQDSTDLIFGQPKVYTVTWTNNGPDAADGAQIRDLLSGQASTGGAGGINFVNREFVSCVPTGGAQCPVITMNASSGTAGAEVSVFAEPVTVPVLPAGGSITITYRLTPTGYSGACTGNNARATLRNRGLLQGIPDPTTDPVSANNTVSVDSVPGPLCVDMGVTKSVSPAAVAPGGAVSFVLDVTVPTGGPTVTGATLRDILPAGFVFDGVSAVCTLQAGTSTCGGFTWNPLTREFASVIPSINGGATQRWTLTGTAITYSSSWPNTAELILPATFWDPAPGSNASTVSFNVQGADPRVTKQSIDKQIRPGDPVRYRVTLSNSTAATGTLADVVLQDTLPSGFSFVSTTNITLVGGATLTSSNPPTVGSATPQWGTYQVPAGGSIIVLISTQS